MCIKTREEFEGMQHAGIIAREILNAMKKSTQPGITTAELDAVGAAVMRQHGGRSAPAMVYGFPGVNLISINDEAVHRIPGNRKVRDSDLAKLDVIVEKDGFIADCAETVAAGNVTARGQRLIACARRAFEKALRFARAGVPVYEIGRAVEKKVRNEGFAVLRQLGGHGVGRTIHEEPSVPNFADRKADTVLEEGLVITIEPIIASGPGQSFVDDDGWTIRTVDRSHVAHDEHTIMIRKDQPILFNA
jgi:methionyl aminopeptidase